ncbi:MAG: hypothetical protein ACRYF3_05365 [Janthinobacterium lividum]
MRGWTRPRIVALIGYLLMLIVELIGGALLPDRFILIVAALLLLLTPVIIWRTGRRSVGTTISQAGITIRTGPGPRGRTHVTWAAASEVYVAGAWQAHSSVRTTANQEFPLPGLDRTRAAKLAAALRVFPSPATVPLDRAQ